jgi:hypothetical protein
MRACRPRRPSVSTFQPHLVSSVYVSSLVDLKVAGSPLPSIPPSRPGTIGAAPLRSDVKAEKLEAARGSGNSSVTWTRKHADAEQFKAILAAEIVKMLDKRGLTRTCSAKRQAWLWVISPASVKRI